MRIHEIITENDELNEVLPLAALGTIGSAVVRAAPAIGRVAKSAYNTVKGAVKGKKAISTKAQDLGGMPRSFPGGRAVSHGGIKRTGVDKVNTISKTQKSHLSGKTVPPGAKPLTSPKTKPAGNKSHLKTKVDPNAQMKYSGAGRYTQKIPKK